MDSSSAGCARKKSSACKKREAFLLFLFGILKEKHLTDKPVICKITEIELSKEVFL